MNGTELWPDELWKLLHALQKQTTQPNRKYQPQINITGKNCPKYVSPSGDRLEFHEGLKTLERKGVVQIEWQDNASEFVKKVRLITDQDEEFNRFLCDHSPFVLKDISDKPLPIDWSILHRVTDKYGQLGLRTASQIAFGKSHRLDNINLPDSLNLWQQPDPKIEGAGVIRLAGKMALKLPYAVFYDRWDIPGLYLWEWDIRNLDIQGIGKSLFLIENPYPMWELMRRWVRRNVTLICLHGFENVSRTSVLASFLERVYLKFPHLNTQIWCDPDPQGLKIATYTHQLVSLLGGQGQFWLMDENIFESLENIILADTKLQHLDRDTEDYQILGNLDMLHPDLHPLANVLQKRNQKGEQEALVVSAI